MFESDSNSSADAVSRRRFLKIATGSILGVAFGTAAVEAATAATAPSASPGRSKKVGLTAAKAQTYKGQTYAIVNVDGKERLQLNGELLSEHHFARTKAGYASHMLPFENAASPDQLAKKLIDGDRKLYYLASEGTPAPHQH